MVAKNYGRFGIPIDGQWSLKDLYKLPRAFEQVYFALDAILPSFDEEAEDRVSRAFRAFPWQGGYSAVNFYNQLKYATPRNEQPRIASIQYASPGWIELTLYLSNALALCFVVNRVSGSIERCNRAYNAIITDLMRRKLLKVELERAEVGLARDEVQLIREYAEQMAEILSLSSAEDIHIRTRNPLISLKILLSIYRRVKILADYQIKGKADFSRKPDE
ncbi:hypothetical protein G4G27_13785 [Sphingomonas sp. So64.6b]|uniref:hypothetical protein n=1 Tax=Sphingomonas sp. So64.6b TaxID=2997354 RepID=UPI0016044731|nr:hypothetical protein [Sphingomonas sp. So64.6b]QNA84946.1 hypothetical protein G4G27_13785 [Sphingomonas sp. So64.6b]